MQKAGRGSEVCPGVPETDMNETALKKTEPACSLNLARVFAGKVLCL